MPSIIHLFLYTIIFFMSLNGLFARVLPLDALSITALRSAIAACGLLALVILRSPQKPLGVRRGAGIYLLGTLLGIHWVTFFHSMQIAGVAVGMLSLFSFPMMTILLEPFFSGKRLSGADILSGATVLAGLLIMVSPGLNHLSGFLVAGVAWGVLSALLFSLRNLWQKYRYADISSERLMLHQVFAIALMLCPLIDGAALWRLSAGDVLNLFLLGLLCTAAAHTGYAYCLKHFPAKSVALVGCLQPVMATLLAWLVLGEAVTVNVLLGGGLILGVAVYETATGR